MVITTYQVMVLTSKGWGEMHFKSASAARKFVLAHKKQQNERYGMIG